MEAGWASIIVLFIPLSLEFRLINADEVVFFKLHIVLNYIFVS